MSIKPFLKTFLFKINPAVFLLSVSYFIYTLYHTAPYDINFPPEQKFIFFFVKTAAFLIITFAFQAVYNIFKKIRQKDTETIRHTKFFLFYFLLNIFLIYLTKPFAVSHQDYFNLVFMPDYNISCYTGAVYSIFYSIINNIFPALYSVPIACSILYSLIFVFFIDTVQKHVSQKYWFISFLLFCLPHTLLWNMVQYRQIFGAYLLLFILTALFRFQHTVSNKISYAVLFSIACAASAALRNENIFLVFLFPAAVFFLKIFSKKAAGVFLSLFLLLTGVSYSLQHYLSDKEYIMHNLAFVFEHYAENKLPLDEYEKHKSDFHAVFLDFDKYKETKDVHVLLSNMNLDNNESAKIVKLCLAKMILKRSAYLIKQHLRDIKASPNTWIIFNKEREADYDFSIQDYPGKYTILSALFLYQDDTAGQISEYKNIIEKYYSSWQKFASNTFFNIYLDLLLMLLSGIYGVITRQKFYTVSFIILLSMLAPVLIFMPFGMYYYLYPVIFCTWGLFFMISAEFLEYLRTLLKSKV